MQTNAQNAYLSFKCVVKIRQIASIPCTYDVEPSYRTNVNNTEINLWLLIWEPPCVRVKSFFICTIAVKTTGLCIPFSSSFSINLDATVDPSFSSNSMYVLNIFNKHKLSLFTSFVTILNGKKIKIDGCQFETDGCFESKNYILIIELKNGKNIMNYAN